jgi:hypothetical protein
MTGGQEVVGDAAGESFGTPRERMAERKRRAAEEREAALTEGISTGTVAEQESLNAVLTLFQRCFNAVLTLF